MRSTFGAGVRRLLFAGAGPITSACGESQSQQQRESNMNGQLMRSKIRKTEFNRLCWGEGGKSCRHGTLTASDPTSVLVRLVWNWTPDESSRLLPLCFLPESNITVILMLLHSDYITFRHLTCNSHQTGSFTHTVGCFARGRESGKHVGSQTQSAKPLER